VEIARGSRLKRLAALLLLCADGERYDPGFHVHLDRDDTDPGKRPYFTGDIDVTLRAPSYLAVLKADTFREWSVSIDTDNVPDADT
jgi:hypothetical protein